MISVAIDGPAGAGKSTIAKSASKELGYIYVDTGAMYRSIGLYAVRNGIDCRDDKKLKAALNDVVIELKFTNEGQRVIFNGEDVSEAIRTPEASMAASAVSAQPSVREFLLGRQRKMAEENNIIMDGRDIGTVVLPNATVKIFLTASPESRAQRRFKELEQKGSDATFEEVLTDIIKRDEQDMNRPIAPLKPADDSVIVDTTEYNLEQSINAVLNVIKENI